MEYPIAITPNGSMRVLVPKEIIRPGVYWHVNRATGKPEKLPVDAE